MSHFDKQRLTKWCNAKNPELMKDQETVLIRIKGVYLDFPKACYKEHVKEAKATHKTFSGLTNEISYYSLSVDLNIILNQWGDDFVGGDRSKDQMVPFKETGIKYSREVMQHYRAALHKWIDTDMVSQDTFNDMKKTCIYNGLHNSDSDKTRIRVFSPNPVNDDINDIKNYDFGSISRSCLKSFRFFTHGQNYLNEESFNPSAKILITEEFIHIMIIAEKIGVLPVLGPLIASLSHGFAYKQLCTFFQHCLPELDIPSGTYIESG